MEGSWTWRGRGRIWKSPVMVEMMKMLKRRVLKMVMMEMMMSIKFVMTRGREIRKY